jgi:uncharacterized protein (DUF885 family)/imidazolonepropionase-like amidohydrolase
MMRHAPTIARARPAPLAVARALRAAIAVALAVAPCAGPAPLGAQAPAPPAATPTAAPTEAEFRRIAAEYQAAARRRDSAARTGWGDASPAARAEAARQVDRWLAGLRALDAGRLADHGDRIAYGLLREALESQAGFRACRAELWNVSHFGGPHLALAGAARSADVGTEEARGRALERFRRFPAVLAQAIADARDGLRQGYSAPRENVRRVIEQLDALTTDDVAASPLHGPASRDSSPGAADFRARWAAMLRDDLHPALRRYRAFLADEYLPRARADIGLGGIPDGRACYAAQLRSYTSLDLDPDELTRISVRESAAVDSALRPLLDSLVGPMPLAAAKRAVRTDPRFRYRSAEEMLALSREVLARAEAAAPRVFARVPQVPLVVEATPAYLERSDAPARYLRSPRPGAPATYYLNTYRASEQPRMNAVVSAAHEGIPGHHLETTYAPRPDDPIRRDLWTPAFREGWGMYAEPLAGEMGLYPSALEHVGVLMHLLDAWVALRVDAGLHARGWTRDQAIDTTMLHTGKSREVAASYADRHAATPGQLVSYMVGYLELRTLRERAERELGAAFDLREFHDQVLGEGPMTLPMLRAKIGGWIAGRRAAAAPEGDGSRGALQPGALAIVGVNVVPMTSDTVLRDATVLVRDGRIARMGPRGEVPVPAGARRIEGGGRWLIPGLADMHVHLFSDGDVPDAAAADELGVMVANGVTAVRLMNGTPEQLALRDDVRAGRVVGPQLWLASPELAGRAYGGEGFRGRVVATPAQGRDAVREAAGAGYDFVKLTLFVAPEAFDAVADEARRRGIRLVGHVDPRVGVARALAAGQSIEHLDDYLEQVLADSAPMRTSVSDRGLFRAENWLSLDHVDDAKVARIAGETARSGTWTTPTLGVFKRAFALGVPDSVVRAWPDWRHYPPELLQLYATARERHWALPVDPARRVKWAGVRDRLVKAIADSGGRILAGSDTPEWFHVYGFALHRELESLVAAGLTPYQALAAATREPAAYLRASSEWGTIAPGRRADLVLVDGNPLEDVRSTARIRGVAIGGRWLDRPALDAMLRAGRESTGGPGAGR